MTGQATTSGKRAFLGLLAMAAVLAAVAVLRGIVEPDVEPLDAAGLVGGIDVDRPDGPTMARVRALGDVAIPALRILARREIARAARLRREDLFEAAALAPRLTVPQRDAYLEELLRLTLSPEFRANVFWELHRDASPATAARLAVEELHGPYRGVDCSDRWARIILDCSPTEPVAYPWLREVLADPHASLRWRGVMLTRLAGSGVRADGEAVIAGRAQGRRLAPVAEVWADATFNPWSESVCFDPWSDLVWFDIESSGGRRWATVTSGIAGDEGTEPWLVSDEGDGWGQPRYLGQVPRGLRALAAATLAAGDTDGDGWDDALERELGTDPFRADSDGDGVADGQDPSPLVSRQPSGDVEEVLAAAYAAYFGDYHEPLAVPIVVTLPKGTVPFELTGAPWVTFPVSGCAVLPRPSRHKGERVELTEEQFAALNLPPDPCTGTRRPRATCAPFPLSGRAETVHVSFSDPEWSYDADNRCAPPGPEVYIAPGGAEARTEITVSEGASEASGALVHLRRFEGVWVVVGIDQVWIT